MSFIKGQNSVKANSPLALNARGIALLKESGFQDIFDKVKDELVSKMEKKSPKTKYNVQKTAVIILYDLRAEEYEPFEEIKSYCYNNGKDYGEILSAGAIILRNYYFKKHPEIK